MIHDSDLVDKLLNYVDILRQRGDSEELAELIELAVREIDVLKEYRKMYIDMWKD